MPAFLSHYACGVCGFNSMEDGIVKRAIYAHSNVFNTALAGPDLFFYSIGETIIPGRNIGSQMHKYRTGAFLQALFEESLKWEGSDRETAIAYTAGFIGHYSLDTNAHPLVFGRTVVPGDRKRSLGKHYRYEAAMDVFTCEKVLGRHVNDSQQMGLLRLRRREKDVVSKMLANAIHKVYPDADHQVSACRMRLILTEYYLLTGLILDPTGFKEWLVTLYEKTFKGYTYMSPLLINGNTYGLGESDYRTFRRCFDRGIHVFEEIMPALEMAVRDPEKYEPELCEKIGNRSYHTGKEMEKEQTLND